MHVCSHYFVLITYVFVPIDTLSLQCPSALHAQFQCQTSVTSLTFDDAIPSLVQGRPSAVSYTSNPRGIAFARGANHRVTVTIPNLGNVVNYQVTATVSDSRSSTQCHFTITASEGKSSVVVVGGAVVAVTISKYRVCLDVYILVKEQMKL